MHPQEHETFRSEEVHGQEHLLELVEHSFKQEDTGRDGLHDGMTSIITMLVFRSVEVFHSQ